MHRTTRTMWALALGLAASGWLVPAARAASMASTTPTMYSTVGQVSTPSGGVANLVYFNGIGNGTIDPTAGVNLGTFSVSSLAATTPQTYSANPFQVIVSTGGSTSEQISGTISGMVGPGATTPLTATITGITQYGSSPLPFTINLPMNTPLTLNSTLPGGEAPALTQLFSPVTLVAPAPVPEPASLTIFAVSLGGLGLWARRRRRAAR